MEIKKFKKFSYLYRLKTIYVNELSLYLTDKENEIFKILIDNKNVSLSKKELLSKVIATEPKNHLDGLYIEKAKNLIKEL